MTQDFALLTVLQARSWIGTRFRHQGRIKRSDAHGGGVDCLGLIAGVARELSLTDGSGQPLSDFDERSYSKMPDGSYLCQRLDALMERVSLADMDVGDVVVFRLDHNPQHLAIVSPYNGDAFGMIHAYAPARKVVEHRMDESWKERLYAAFRFRPNSA